MTRKSRKLAHNITQTTINHKTDFVVASGTSSTQKLYIIYSNGIVLQRGMNPKETTNKSRELACNISEKTSDHRMDFVIASETSSTPKKSNLYIQMGLSNRATWIPRWWHVNRGNWHMTPPKRHPITKQTSLLCFERPQFP